MLLVDEKQIKLEQSFQKILNFYPAYNNTYCFLGMLGFKQDCVAHIDEKGKVLYKEVFQNPMDSFAMLSDRQCIMLETRKDCITVFNLETHTFKRTPFKFINEQTDQSFLHTFSETKYLCVRQVGRYNDSHFKLSYFHYPLKQDSKPFHQFDSTDDWTYENLVRQANQHSQIAWFKGRQDENWQISIYEIKDSGETLKGQKNKYNFINRVGQPYGINKVQVALKTMWEIRPSQYLLVCDTDKNKPQQGPINNNFVLDIRTGMTRQAKFTFGEYQDFQIDMINFGRAFMIRTFKFEGGKPVLSPVYYIDSSTQDIIGQEQWLCSHRSKYELPGYDQTLLVQALYENADVLEITVHKKKIINVKQILMFFMLEIYPNFDFDLLINVLQIVDYNY